MSVIKNKKTGKWEAWYYTKDNNGKLKRTAKKGFSTSVLAKKWEFEHRHETNINNKKLFKDVFEEANKASQANELTISTRRNRLVKYASKIWNTPIIKINKNILIKWRNYLDETDLSTSTKNYIINHLRQVFLYAYQIYDIPDTSKVLKKFSKKLNDIKPINTITYEQLMKILKYETDEVLKIFFQFLFITGCRKGEARALLKTDFDGVNTILITKSMRRYEHSLTTTKNKTQRHVILDDNTASKIAELCKRKGPYIFGDYSPLSLTKITEHFNKCLCKSGFKHVRIHDLRHSNVSVLWAAGVPIPEISKRIGHSSPKTTMEVYAHAFDNKQQASCKYLNELTKK